MIILEKIAIIGLGYVGLPLAQIFISKNYTVFGIDTDTKKIKSIKEGESYLSDVSNKDIKGMLRTDKFHVSSSFKNIVDADAIILCVPTPLSTKKTPDISYIENAIKSSLPFLKPGQLIILESSTYPGTTEEVIVPNISKKGFSIGKDFFVAYSPERIDPGQMSFTLEEIPKIVGGVTPHCTEKASVLYTSAFQQVVPVSSAKVAEMSKLVENAQRLINISFMNEIAMFCDKLDISIWEVIDACSTKPFGFTPYYPGPGIGGHCIPVDPLFLLWKAKGENLHLSLIEAANNINESIPDYVVDKVIKQIDQPISKATIYILGVTYKKNVNDTRESKALNIIERLLKLGAKVNYYDPFIPELVINQTVLQSTPIDSKILETSDCTLILTDHTGILYEKVAEKAKLIIDTRNALKTKYL